MKKTLLWIALAGVATGAIAWTRQSSNLYIGGNLASSALFMHNGVACVPIKDVATALKMTIQKTGRGLEMTDAGGANQVNGITGKVGDVLWNGYVRLTVVKVIRGKTYTNQFSGDSAVVTPNQPSDDLVVIVCKMSNGLKNGITVEYPGAETALTDNQGQSYAPKTSFNVDIPSRGVELLPGAAFNFALTYNVPSTAVIGDMVYQCNLAGTGTNGSEKKKFRVTVKE